MTSNHHAPYVLGYTRATMAGTKGSEAVKRSESQKAGLSSDCRLQFACMKSESLVIAGQHTAVSGIGFSTDFPSPTPFGLSLGPGLLWADDPSPEILRFSAGRILTCLCVYSYRHSHFRTLHNSLRYCFYVYGTLPYPSGGIATALIPCGSFSRKSLLKNFKDICDKNVSSS
jgi:hypothetical protein